MFSPVYPELEKVARIFEVDDVENFLGSYINDAAEPLARQMVQEQYGKRFALRHPVLTGIPTLGIWPAISKQRATEDVGHNIARRFDKYREARSAMLEKARQQYLENQRMEIERDKANQISRAAASLAGGYVSGEQIKRSY